MAQAIVDDIDQSVGAERVRFSLNGKTYEIDLGPENRKKLEDALAPFIKAGQAVNSTSAPRKVVKAPVKKKPHVVSVKIDKSQETVIRKWAAKKEAAELRELAKQAGKQDVPDRGRVPLDALVAAWNYAHPPKTSAPRKAAKDTVDKPSFSHAS